MYNSHFMARIDLSELSDYIEAYGKSHIYAKGEAIVQQGCLCRYVGVVRSGYFKYEALNSKGDEVVTGFSFEDEVVTDYVQGFLFDLPSLTNLENMYFYQLKKSEEWKIRPSLCR